jgi:hypothetical protein
MHFQLEDLEAHFKMLKQSVATRQRVISEYGKVLTEIWASFQSYSGKLRPSMAYTSSQWTREDKFLDIPACRCSTLRELSRRKEALQSARVELEVIKPTFSWIRLKKEQAEESQVRLYLIAASHVQALRFHRCHRSWIFFAGYTVSRK